MTRELTRLLRLFRIEPLLAARFVVTSLGRAGLGMATILLIKEFLSGVLGSGGGLAGDLAGRVGTGGALWTVAGLLWFAYVTSGLLAYDNQVTQQRIVKVLELGMMDRLLRHLLRLSIPFFDRQSHGDIIQAVRRDVEHLRLMVFALAGIALDALHAAGLFAAALWLSPRLTLWALVLLPIAALPLVLLARRALARSRSVRKTGYALFDAVLQLLRGVRVIKVFRAEERVMHQTMEQSRQWFDEMIAMVQIRSGAQVLLESLASTGIVVVIVVGGFDVMAGRLEWPTLLAFVFAVRALHAPMNGINTHLVSLVSQGAAAERLAELLATVPEVAEATRPKPLPGPPAEIRFEDVAFAYGEVPVVHGITLTLRAGETLGVVGPSGAGKSTLVNLVARFYDPSRGVIRFDGTDLREHSLEDLYRLMAIVTQEPFLFSATVRENIRAGRPEATDAEVEDAARAVGIHEEILGFAEGYETRIGQGYTGVSGGQAQRVNIARALLKNPPILLLDEATSNLDSLAELKVQRALERLMEGRTTIVVAHRLSTLRGADRILVLEDGTPVGLAPHGELLATCPLYQHMWELQQIAAEHAAAPAPLPTLPDADEPGTPPPTTML